MEGIVFLPSGSSTWQHANVPAGIWLKGSGAHVSVSSVTTDTTPVLFAIDVSSTMCPVGRHDGGMEEIQVRSYQIAAATTPLLQPRKL
jgi:hypothetical protein